MKAIFHLGLHCTDEHRLERCLRQNVTRLAESGTVIPDPETYRPVLRNVVNAMQGAAASPETEQTILDTVMIEDEASRIVFSNEAFLCIRTRVLAKGALYANAPEKVAALANLLPSCETEMAFAIRNPATFLPALWQSTKVASFDEFIAGTDPATLSWAEMVGRIREALPDLPMTIWCDEDTPLIWPDVLRAVAGCGPEVPLEGEDEVLTSIMSEEGRARLADYMAKYPAMTHEQRRRVSAAFLDKYALAEAVEMELDLPGWDEAFVEAMTARYEADVAAIAAMPGVRLIAP